MDIDRIFVKYIDFQIWVTTDSDSSMEDKNDKTKNNKTQIQQNTWYGRTAWWITDIN